MESSILHSVAESGYINRKVDRKRKRLNIKTCKSPQESNVPKIEPIIVNMYSINDTILALMQYIRSFPKIKVYISESSFFNVKTSELEFLRYSSEFCMGKCNNDYGAFKSVIPDIIQKYSILDLYFLTCTYGSLYVYILVTFQAEPYDEQHNEINIITCGAQINKFDFILPPSKIPEVSGSLTKGAK